MCNLVYIITGKQSEKYHPSHIKQKVW
uniref:Uncharacterized protein n=1 Tax=Arundo donax TaxID=35708 RepID=A0A0A9B2E6_ARUDO